MDGFLSAIDHTYLLLSTESTSSRYTTHGASRLENVMKHFRDWMRSKGSD